MLLPSYQRQDDYFRKLTLQKLPQRSKEFAQFWLSIFSSLTLRSSMAFSNCAKGWRSSTTVSSFCTATSLLRVSSSTTRGRGRSSDSTFACRTRSPMESIQTGTSLSTMPWPVTRSGIKLHQSGFLEIILCQTRRAPKLKFTLKIVDLTIHSSIVLTLDEVIGKWIQNC